MENRSLIAEYYDGKNILITGASGLIGKVLIWKLLSSCPNVDTIYILIRPKRGKSIKLRTEELLQVPIFNTFKKDSPKLLEKIVPIEGDVALENLGISAKDEDKLVNQIHIVFHIAAMLKLDANLKDAVIMNTQGTLRLLNLSTKMRNLEVFMHTSTAYCHCDIDVMDEKIYPTEESPYDVIGAVHWLKPSTLESITNKVIKPHPNSYTYTKRLAERIVADFYPRLPVSIARPSIVIPAWEEPIPGWVDNLNGPTGLLIGAGKGVIRTMLCNGEYDADLVPVDTVCNGLIAAAWNVATNPNKPAEIPVFNLIQCETESTTWQSVIELGKEIIFECPFELMLWYPGGNIHRNKLQHYTLAVLQHWIPAILIDFLMLLLGRKRFMINVHKKVYHGQKLLQYFTTRNWKFLNNNILKLRESLTALDKATFKLTLKNIDRRSYLVNATLVARNYILKDDPNSIPKSRTRLKILYVVDLVASLLFYLLVAWAILRVFDSMFSVSTEKSVHV